MKILVVNCGSSSIKYRVFEADDGLKPIAWGVIERIGEEVSYFRYRSIKGELSYSAVIRDHEQGFEKILEVLMDEDKGVIRSVDEIRGVGHRVVHGGEEIWEPTIIDERVEEVIEKYSALAPLHNPSNLKGIRISRKFFPKAVHIAVFDTAFHRTLPEEAYLYPIPYEYYEKYRIRRYGFHGISHRYVAYMASRIIGEPLEDLRMITCHLGAGASITAIKGGKSVETSMGLTPLEGLMMATRSGDIDPSIIYFLMMWEKLSIDEVYDILNNRSGLLGVSGVGKDLREIRRASEEGNRRASLAIKMFVHRVKKYIGAYAAIMGGLDALVFTAGIGERAPWIRSMILKGLEFLGILIDEERNEHPEKYGWMISSDESRVRVLVIPTNEELAIAEEVLKRVAQHHL